MSVELRAARTSDTPLIDAVCTDANTSPERGPGYPRCADAAELVAELSIYQGSLETGVCTVEVDGRFAGITGLLVDPDDREAYLIGPQMLPDHHRVDVCAAVLPRILAAVPDGVTEVRACVQDENTVLRQVFTQARVAGTLPGRRDALRPDAPAHARHGPPGRRGEQRGWRQPR